MGVFILSHVLIARTGIRPALVARFGERAYLAAYSTLSLLLLGWVIAAVVMAQRHVFWATPEWAYGFAAVVSAAGFVLIGIGAAAPNPLSVSFRREGFEPERPGAVGWVRHPLIWGLTLWGLAHVPANGDWPSVVLFGGSAAFGAIGTQIVDRRRRREFGPHTWQRLCAGRGHIDRRALVGAACGLALWLVLLVLHPILFRADPLAVLLARYG
ncbi:MAG: NnrU family protein [Halioglobus sp.]|nr:NnrU family protein [Halioglobus sp.]